MLLARPWWVNLLVVAPIASYYLWRRKGISLARRALIAAFVFGIAFGFVEAAVVVYLRLASGLLPISSMMGSQAASHSGEIPPTAQVLASLPEKLVAIETLREAATVVMLASLAVLAAKDAVGRSALFLWTFATWDIAYYAGLRALIQWPSSLRDIDVLFLIPVPWISEVWFPLAVSALMLAAVIAATLTSRPCDTHGDVKRSGASLTAVKS